MLILYFANIILVINIITEKETRDKKLGNIVCSNSIFFPVQIVILNCMVEPINIIKRNSSNVNNINIKNPIIYAPLMPILYSINISLSTRKHVKNCKNVFFDKLLLL